MKNNPMTDELMNLPLIPNKFIKEKLFDIDKNIIKIASKYKN